MAVSVKISGLLPSSTAEGPDELPISRNGVTRSITITQLIAYLLTQHIMALPITSTAADYVVGTIAATLPVLDSSGFTVGTVLVLTDGTNRLTVGVTAKPTNTSITVLPLSPRPTGDAANGVTLASGSVLTVSGSPGAAGTNGANPITLTTAAYTQAVGATSIAVADSTAFVIGVDALVVSGANKIHGTITGKADATHVTFTPYATIPTGDTSAGAVYPISSTIALSGIQGATGAAGSPGAGGGGGSRQAILLGAVNSTTGVPSFLAIGTGLAVNLAATAVPLVLTFAAGTTSTGPTDFTAAITADVTGAWSGLTANTTCYLYVDRNGGTPTYGFSVLAPVYQAFAPTNANGQHWYDTSSGTMKVGNGTTWTAQQRVFVGSAVTSGAAVTSVAPYSVGGQILPGHFRTPGNSRVKVINPGTSSLSAGAGGSLGFTTKQIDALNEWDTTLQRYTARESGWRLITGQVGVVTAGASTDYGYVNLTFNGGNNHRCGPVPAGTTTNSPVTWVIPINIEVYMAAGDYMDVSGLTSFSSTIYGSGLTLGTRLCIENLG